MKLFQITILIDYNTHSRLRIILHTTLIFNFIRELYDFAKPYLSLKYILLFQNQDVKTPRLNE